MRNKVDILNREFKSLNPEEIIARLCKEYKEIVFSTSFGKEDQAIISLISHFGYPVNVFTLDTGRLFEETYEVFQRTIEKYNIKIDVMYPQSKDLQHLLSNKGPFSFYNSVEERIQCCNIRKIEPLKRALKGKEIWITGLRKEQSSNRNDMEMVEWDEGNNLIKVNPFFYWTQFALEEYLDKNNVPINSLHKRGFPSIGCSPCTRSIIECEDERAGRWWWENSKKECGLHQIK